MARKLGQIVARGQSTWLVRIYQGAIPRPGCASTTTKPSMDRFAKRIASLT